MCCFCDVNSGDGSYIHDEPLSPTKALRAAILKRRFAGTIVKAQQKALLDHVMFLNTHETVFIAIMLFTCSMQVFLCTHAHAVLISYGQQIDPAKLQMEKERLEKRQQQGNN
jgi:hypothetical protein